jgi:hypothetical protein
VADEGLGRLLLNTPKFTQLLPGYKYDGPDSDAFSSLAETIAYFDEYAEVTSAPVRNGMAVTSLRPTAHGFELETAADTLQATNVVVATGVAAQAEVLAPLRGGRGRGARRRAPGNPLARISVRAKPLKRGRGAAAA